MQEIEVKILEIDKEAIIKKIESLRAKKIFEGRIVAHYLDTPNDDLWKEGTVLRVRTRGETTELTLKKKVKGRKDIKHRDEYEIKVDDFEMTKQLLEQLGFVEREYKEDKRRITYALDDSHVEIEDVEGIPTYLEIESKSIEELEKIVEKLGYKMSDTTPMTAGEVRKHYGDKKVLGSS